LVAVPRATIEPARLRVAALVVVLAAVLPHLGTLDHDWVVDDPVQISENRAVVDGAPFRAFFFDRSTTSARADYNTRIYRPLRNVAFRGLVAAFGARPLVLGVSNLLLYALASLLVLAFALALTGSLAASTWAAVLWAILPVHVEPVAYASALGDQLSAVLQLGALLWGWKVLRGEGSPRRQLGLAAASLALQLGAMLAKEMAITSVGSLTLGALLLPEARRARRSWALVAAHLALAIAYLALRTHVVGRLGQESVTPATVLTGLARAPLLLVGYLRISVAPLGHRFTYEVPRAGALAPVAALASLAAATALAVWADRRWRRPPGLLFGLGWFVIALAPVLQLVPVWAELADRFALIPSVGLALATACLLAQVPAARWRLAHFACGVLALIYGSATLIEGRFWRNDLVLWTHAVEDQPDSALAHGSLGAVLLSQGRFADALTQLELADSLGAANAHTDVRHAMALEGAGRTAEAMTWLRRALARDPQLGQAHALLGELLQRSGRTDEARAELDLARRWEPAHPSTLLLEAKILDGDHRYDEAADVYKKMSERSPGEPRFVYLYARELLAGGHADEALASARRCRALAQRAMGIDQPQCACVEGRALLAAGDRAAARGALDDALAGLPEGPERALCVQARAAAGP
jgi:tetratricopeptide (TPR) repeat protein